MRRTVREQHPQPVTGHEPPVLVQPALRRGVEVEGLNELVAVQIVGDQSRHMLDEVGKLECSVTASRVLEVDRPDPDPVPRRFARLPSACPSTGSKSAASAASSDDPSSHLAPSRHACWTTGSGKTVGNSPEDDRTCAIASAGLQTRRGVAASAAAGTQRCRNPTAAAIDSTGAGPPAPEPHGTPGRRDMVTCGGSPARSTSNGAGARPGANSFSSKSAPHSRAGSPRSQQRNGLITWSGPSSTSCVLVPSGIAA